MLEARPGIVAGLLFLAVARGAFADSVPVAADSFIDTKRPSRRFGKTASLVVRSRPASERHAFVRFDLSSLPQGVSLARATLRAWVAAAPVPGTMSLAVVSDTWQESTLSGANAPAAEAPFAELTVSASDRGLYVTVDVTEPVQAWLDGARPNNGFVLSPITSTMDISFDSKENAGTSHAMELELVPAGPPDHTADIAELRQQVSSLESQVETLQRILTPRNVWSIDCGAGEKIQDAISGSAYSLPVYIEISGVCQESLQISRDNVGLNGVTPDAGIAAPSGSTVALSIDGARSVSLRKLSLQATDPSYALSVVSGQLTASEVRIQGSASFARSSSIELFDSEINGRKGVVLGQNSYLGIFRSTVTGSSLYGIRVIGGDLQLSDTRVEDNGQGGLLVERGGSAHLESLTARGNGGPGVVVRETSTIDLSLSNLIEQNTVGLIVGGGSYVHLGDVVIEENLESGVVITDVSSVSAVRPFHGPRRITANGGWGIHCASPEVPQLTGIVASNVFGNAFGQINCPGF